MPNMKRGSKPDRSVIPSKQKEALNKAVKKVRPRAWPKEEKGSKKPGLAEKRSR